MIDTDQVFNWLLLICLIPIPLAMIAFVFLQGWRRIATIAVVACLPTLFFCGYVIFGLLRFGISANASNVGLISLAFVLAYNLFFWLPPTIVGALFGAFVKRKQPFPGPQ